jgi:integrase
VIPPKCTTGKGASAALGNPTDPWGAAKRWVPWLCAYTGGRVGELTQLRVKDIEQRACGPVRGPMIPKAKGEVLKEAAQQRQNLSHIVAASHKLNTMEGLSFDIEKGPQAMPTAQV